MGFNFLLIVTAYPIWIFKYTRSSEDYFNNNTDINACLCFTLIVLLQNIFRVQIIIIAYEQPQRKVKPASEIIREGGEVEAGVVQVEEAGVTEEEEGSIWLQSIEQLLLSRQERQGLLSLR